MIYVYFALLMLSGLAVANLPWWRPSSLSCQLALAPALAMALPSLIVFLLHFGQMPINSLSLGTGWISSLCVICYFAAANLQLTIQKLGQLLTTTPRATKIALWLLIFSLIGLNLSASLKEIWPGDGFGNWALKAREWSYYQKFAFTPHIAIRLSPWMNYPVYHSVGMMINMLFIPGSFGVSIKYSDTFYFCGIIFTAISFLRHLQIPISTAIGGGLLLSFAPRTYLNMINSGYADINVAYLLYLALFLGIFYYQRTGKLFLTGLTFGLLAITKNEGLFRALISFGILWYFVGRQQWRTVQKWSAILLPILFLWLINRSIVQSFRPPLDLYLQSLNFSWPAIMAQLPTVSKALLWSYWLEVGHIYKCFWPISLLLSTFWCVYYYRYCPQNQTQILLPLKILIVIFWAQTLFNILPPLLAPLPNYLPFQTAKGIADIILVRLNAQIALLISTVCLAPIPFYFHR